MDHKFTLGDLIKAQRQRLDHQYLHIIDPAQRAACDFMNATFAVVFGSIGFYASRRFLKRSILANQVYLKDLQIRNPSEIAPRYFMHAFKDMQVMTHLLTLISAAISTAGLGSVLSYSGNLKFWRDHNASYYAEKQLLHAMYWNSAQDFVTSFFPSRTPLAKQLRQYFGLVEIINLRTD